MSSENNNSSALDIANEKIQLDAKRIMEQNETIKNLKKEKSNLKVEIENLEGENSILKKKNKNLKYLNNNLRKESMEHDVEKITLQKKHHKHLQSVIDHAKKMNRQNFISLKF